MPRPQKVSPQKIVADSVGDRVVADEEADDRFARAFGAAVKDFRAKMGISQEELSFRAGLDRTYISGVERGVRNPTVKTIWRIASALSTQPSALFERAETNRLRAGGI